LPTEQNLQTNEWEDQHLPNLTGTDFAYHPGGSVVKPGQRQKSTADYEAWKPE